MNRSIGIGTASLAALALLVVTARQATTQVGGSLPAFVKLQATTPGTAQTGHSNITGTAIAGQHAGGGSGLTGVNADLLDGINSTSFLQSIPNPLVLSGTSGGWIISGQNASTANGSMGIFGVSTAATGNTYGGHFSSASTDGWGVWGWASASTGTTFGMVGLSNSSSGTGVFGRASSLGGVSYGGRFESDSTLGHGVFGRASASTGTNYGARFEAASTSGRGVFGYAIANSGTTYGGYFQSDSTGGRAVLGWATAGSGATHGGSFESASTSGRGVYGLASASNGATYGVFGLTTSPDGRGVFGSANSGFGGTNGVRGESNSPDGRGVLGFASASNGTNYGVRGQSDSPNGYGVYSVGAFGASGTKTFRIDHPSNPENMYLLHYSTESPEPMNFYSGVTVTDAQGVAWIQLPNYFGEINKDFRYTLTVVDDTDSDIFVQAKVAREIRDNRFKIRTSAPRVKVSWRIEAVRNDRWVQEYGAPIEVEKVGREMGRYQHPELYGKPASMGMNYDPKRPVAGENSVARP